jgi:hypothetical protein
MAPFDLDVEYHFERSRKQSAINKNGLFDFSSSSFVEMEKDECIATVGDSQF